MVASERWRIEGAQGAVVCDTRYLPIVLMRWYGEADRELLEGFGRWMDELLRALVAEDLYIATIVDLTRADAPSPKLRRRLLELRTRHQRHSEGRVMIDAVVTNRPSLRAVVQTFVWINPRAPAVVVPTIADALHRCLVALQRAGVAAPSIRAEDLEAD